MQILIMVVMEHRAEEVDILVLAVLVSQLLEIMAVQVLHLEHMAAVEVEVLLL
jgi:hypothetical protein